MASEDDTLASADEMLTSANEPLEDLFEQAPDAAAHVGCPYCGEVVELLLDPGGGDIQRYVEDCEVCCRPWQIEVRYDPSGAAVVSAQTAD